MLPLARGCSSPAPPPPAAPPARPAPVPQGCWANSPSSAPCNSGTLFYAYPTGDPRRHIGTAVRLEYEVFLPAGFDFVKGGKLPGLMGGPSGDCGGGADPDGCFSVRLMWRRDGAGEAYMYVPQGGQQDPGFCATPGTKCDEASGAWGWWGWGWWGDSPWVMGSKL